MLAPSSSTKSSISLLDQFKFKSKPAVAEPSENADSVDMDMDKGDNTQVVTEKENVTNNVDPKGKLPLHPRDSNVAL